MVQSSWRARRSRTAAIRLSSGMENCAGRLERHSLASLMVAAAFAPATRSLISTSPLARSLLPWMTTHGAPALVGVFHLRLHTGAAEIHLGANAGLAQRLRHPLVARQLGLIHDEHDDGATGGGALVLVEGGERRLQTRNANGKTCCRHLAPQETLDQTVVAPTAADRAEAHGLAVLVFDRKAQFGLEHGAGVVFEAPHHRGSMRMRSSPKPLARTSSAIASSS